MFHVYGGVLDPTAGHAIMSAVTSRPEPVKITDKYAIFSHLSFFSNVIL